MASSFPSSFCVASVSGSIFARSLTLIPRSLHRNRTERLASQAKSSPLVFFPRQFFACTLQSEGLEQGTPEPSFLGTWLFSILPLPACLFVFVVFLIFDDVYCHILHLRFFVVCSPPKRITLESKQIVPFSLRQSSLSSLLPLQLL